MSLKDAIDKVGKLLIENELNYESHINKVSYYLEKAKEAFENDDFASALNKYNTLIELDPSNKDVIANIAICKSCFTLQDITTLQEISKPLEDYLNHISKDNSEVLYYLCANQFRSHLWQELEQDEFDIFCSKIMSYINKAIEINSEAHYYVLRGELLETFYEDKIEAISDYSTGLAIEDNNLWAYRLRAEAYTDIDNSKAKDDYDKCIELNPSYEHHYYRSRSKIKAKLGDYTGAMSDLLLREKKSSLNGDDFAFMGDMCLKLMEEDQASAYFERAFREYLKSTEPFSKFREILERVRILGKIEMLKNMVNLIDNEYKKQTENIKKENRLAHFYCWRGLLYNYVGWYKLSLICLCKAHELTKEKYFKDRTFKYINIVSGKHQSIKLN